MHNVSGAAQQSLVLSAFQHHAEHEAKLLSEGPHTSVLCPDSANITKLKKVFQEEEEKKKVVLSECQDESRPA